MEQRDINSRTRADTFGLRPDIYDALAGNMVKKDDLGAIGGLMGYGQLKSSNTLPGTSPKPAGSTILDSSNQFNSTWGKGTEPGPESHGLKLTSAGVWVVMSNAVFTPSGSSASEFKVGVRTIQPDGTYLDDYSTHYIGDYGTRISYSGLVVAESAGIVLRPLLICGAARGVTNIPALTLTVYRIDGGVL